MSLGDFLCGLGEAVIREAAAQSEEQKAIASQVDAETLRQEAASHGENGQHVRGLWKSLAAGGADQTAYDHLKRASEIRNT